MAYAHTATGAHDLAIPQSAAPRRGLMRRWLDALIEARMRQADREIARYVAATGGHFTDETEREIERRFFAN